MLQIAVDNQLLVQALDDTAEIITLNNGCVCCKVPGFHAADNMLTTVSGAERLGADCEDYAQTGYQLQCGTHCKSVI